MEKYNISSALLTNKKKHSYFIFSHPKPKKVYNLILFLTIIIFNFLPLGEGRWGCLYSQPVTQEWVKNYPGPSNDLIGPFLAVDKNGNSYIAGTHVINDSINILCVKYNTQGIQQWARLYKYPGEGYFAPTGIALDSSGNAYVISYFAQTYLDPYNGLIVKFNSLNGSPVWAKKYAGQCGASAFSDIKIDRMNNIYVAGASDSSHLVIRYNTNGDSVWVRKYHPQFCSETARGCTIDDSLNIIFTGSRKFYSPYGFYDSLLIVKYSPNGFLRWESVYSSGYSYIVNVGLKITSDQNGNLYIGGVTNVSGLGVYLTLKYDRNGVRQWTKIYNPPGSTANTIYGIAMDRTGNALFVTGYSVINNVGSAATIKYNAINGDSIWVRRGFGALGSSSARDVKVDTLGNAYIIGGSQGVSSSDVSTLKYSPQGNQVWLITYNGSFNGGDGGYTLSLDNANNVYVMGLSQRSSQIFDYILIKYSQYSGIQPVSNKLPNLFRLEQNFPNPFNSATIIKFSIPKKSFVQIQIYDILGRLTDIPINEEINASDYALRLDASKYSSGVYFYRLVAGDFTQTRKMVLLK